MNSVNFIGRMVKDPDYKVTENGKSMCRIVIAVKNKYVNKTNNEDDSSFFTCICWGHVAEFVTNYLGKGRLIGLSGELKNRSWTNQDGTKGYITEVIVDSIESLDRKKENEAINTQSSVDENTYDPFMEVE